jgi:hypothetical protein
MNDFFFRIAAIFSLFFSIVGSVHAQSPAPATGIRILVYGIHYGGNLVYNYKVVNNGDTAFQYFTIGSEFNSTENYELPQLSRRPFGWKYGERGETGTEILLSSASTTQPPSWTSHVFGQQDIGYYYLNWHAIRGHGNGNVSNAILPGQTLAGFSVTVPLVDGKRRPPTYELTAPDEMYIKGGFKVGLVSGEDVWGTLERIDTNSPTLTVSLSPATLWPPNDKPVLVKATLAVQDDYDPAPEIKLESITASEPLADSDIQDAQLGTDDRSFSLVAKRAGNNQAGRIYTVIYSATDASGNKTTASATVTVPHDQGK